MDLISLLCKEGTLKILLQHHSSNSVLCLLYGPALTSVHDYRKDNSIDIWTFLGKMMSLLFNTLSRFVIAFLARSNRPLISRLQSPSAVILEPKKRKSVTSSTFSPSICHEMMGPNAMIFIFLILSFKLALTLIQNFREADKTEPTYL